MSSRIDPAAALKDLGDFAPRPAGQRREVSTEMIDTLAQSEGFPSRRPIIGGSDEPKSAPRAAPLTKPPLQEHRGSPKEATAHTPRRYRTGRNQQFNIKATAETIERFHETADAMNIPRGELLRLALDALLREHGGGE
jgi:hypothetical protein